MAALKSLPRKVPNLPARTEGYAPRLLEKTLADLE
jgi:hypothetical protein